jgi:putative phosphoribosyl transferase
MEEREISIPVRKGTIRGNLSMAAQACGCVIFAHGSGSSRFSPRNRKVAGFLQENGLATLLMDLLTEDEEAIDIRTRRLRFDIGLLAGRLIEAVAWIRNEPDLKLLPIGYFGSSTGAAAALIAAAEKPREVLAVVSRGGRSDLAGDHLPRVEAPTLLIVGGDDTDVLDLNRIAMERLEAEKRLEIVPGATHLFEEPGKLEEVSRLAADWFIRHLGR